MKVLLVGNYAKDRQESMDRFALLMQRGLSGEGHEVRIRRPPVLVGKLNSSRQGLGKWLGYVDKFALFPAVLAGDERWADIVHICDHSYAMYSFHVSTRPVVVTCHDMLAVRGALGEDTDCPASRTGRILQRWIVAGLRRANKIACVSTATSEDVVRIVHTNSLAAQVILNGLNYPYSVLSEETARLRLSPLPRIRPRQFLLHVGSNHRRKNREGVLRVFADVSRSVDDFDLVLAGQEVSPELKDLAKRLGIADRVIEVVKPTNETLEALYNSALALFYPSRFEGFGWPLVEAQACGCPVVCSRCPPFKEVVADAALMREVDDEEGFAADVLRIMREPQEWKTLRCKGLQNVQRFRPETMISAYISLYENLVGH
jgi:glycosyltransferase involved in cell wall biosynthesis